MLTSYPKTDAIGKWRLGLGTSFLWESWPKRISPKYALILQKFVSWYFSWLKSRVAIFSRKFPSRVYKAISQQHTWKTCSKLALRNPPNPWILEPSAAWIFFFEALKSLGISQRYQHKKHWFSRHRLPKELLREKISDGTAGFVFTAWVLSQTKCVCLFFGLKDFVRIIYFGCSWWCQAMLVISTKLKKMWVTVIQSGWKGRNIFQIVRVVTIWPLKTHLVYKLRSLTKSCLLCFILRWYPFILLFRTTWRSQLLHLGNGSLRHYIPVIPGEVFFILSSQAIDPNHVNILCSSCFSCCKCDQQPTFILQDKSNNWKKC